MASAPYTVTISGRQFESFSDETTAVVEAAINSDISSASTFDFTTDEGKMALVRVTRFFASLGLNLPDNFDDTSDVSGDLPLQRASIAAATAREALARAVPNARAIRTISQVVAGNVTVGIPQNIRTRQAQAAAFGFYDQQAYDVMSTYIQSRADSATLVGTEIPDDATVAPTFANIPRG